jgi:hypothetical protein
VLDSREGQGFSVEIVGIGPLAYSRSAWQMHEHDGVTHLDAVVEYKAKFGPLGALMSVLMISRKLGGTLGESLLGLKYYVETGEPVGDSLPHDAKQAA